MRSCQLLPCRLLVLLTVACASDVSDEANALALLMQAVS
jgi:hypothetical protein